MKRLIVIVVAVAMALLAVEGAAFDALPESGDMEPMYKFINEFTNAQSDDKARRHIDMGSSTIDATGTAVILSCSAREDACLEICHTATSGEELTQCRDCLNDLLPLLPCDNRVAPSVSRGG